MPYSFAHNFRAQFIERDDYWKSMDVLAKHGLAIDFDGEVLWYAGSGGKRGRFSDPRSFDESRIDRLEELFQEVADNWELPTFRSSIDPPISSDPSTWSDEQVFEYKVLLAKREEKAYVAALDKTPAFQLSHEEAGDSHYLLPKGDILLPWGPNDVVTVDLPGFGKARLEDAMVALGRTDGTALYNRIARWVVEDYPAIILICY